MQNQFSSKLSLLALFFFMLILGACDNDSTGDVPPAAESEIWQGATITFEKMDGADPNEAANQDRITDNVWLTRGNDGGQIYNASQESGSDKNTSPAGTQWAVGTLDEIDNLEFKSFRDAVGKPKDVEGKNLVLFLTEDEVYLSVKFTKWSEGKAGGFAYERSTE